MCKIHFTFVDKLTFKLILNMLTLIALIATFTVETNKKVSTSGVLPENAATEYICTGRKGQMTAGQSATLTLTNWQNTEIQSVTLSMRSNKSAGAGTLQMTVDGQTVWSIQNSGFDQWSGSYTTDTTDITHLFNPSVKTTDGNISIRIDATVNSLYIARYDIVYKKAALRPYSVDLQTETGIYTRLTENAAGSGVLLPSVSDEDGWKFIGWAENAIEKTTMLPQIYAPKTVYHPRKDISLWAVYSDDIQTVGLLQRTDCQSGYYAIAFPVLNAAYAGAITSSALPAEEINLNTTDSLWYERGFDIAPEMIYYIDFAADSTAAITHLSSSQSIGCKNGKLSDTPTRWHYRVLSDQTVAFFLPDTENQMVSALWIGIDSDKNYCGKVVRLNGSTLAVQSLLYEAPVNEGITHYTSYPKRSDIRSATYLNQPEYTLQMGIYKLYIVNGKKTIYLHK